MTPSMLLLLAVLAILGGPLLSSLGTRLRPVHALIDGFALSLVGVLCIVFVLPHAVDQIGIGALALTAAGLGLPSLLHRLLRSRSLSLWLLGLALMAHSVLDGAVLSIRSDDAPLAWAVVAHRMPVGFAIVVAARVARKPVWVFWGLAVAIILATVVGYLFGPPALTLLPEAGPAGLEAVVAGLLLHVVFAPHLAETEPHACNHSAHGHHHHHHDGQVATSVNGWSAAGALSGLFAITLGVALAGPHGHEEIMPAFLRTFLILVVESAPALLLGYGLAGMVPFLLTPTRTSSLARGGRMAQSLRGIAFGLPLPVCSCGVLPIYESLVRRGVPLAAAMAFFVATPELGLDAVLLSVPLLGSSLTIARVIAAVAVALVVSLLVGGRASASSLPAREPVAADSVAGSWSSRVHASLRFGFVEVFDHTMPWIVLGLVIAAMAEPMLSNDAIDSVPSVLQVPVAALVGVPVYVCASGATPIAALALHKGLSAGAALAFLIAGPATNVTTFGVLARLHGRRTALLFGVSVTALAVLAGWTVDVFSVSAVPILETPPDAHGSWVAWLSVVGLAALTVASLFRQGPRGALQQILDPIHSG